MKSRGWVYLITNESMPGVVKVGFSLKDPQLRAAELETTGTPSSFSVAYDALVVDPAKIEKLVHEMARSQRRKREWFESEVPILIEYIRKASGSNLLYESPRSEGVHPIKGTSPESVAPLELPADRVNTKTFRRSDRFTPEKSHYQCFFLHNGFSNYAYGTLNDPQLVSNGCARELMRRAGISLERASKRIPPAQYANTDDYSFKATGGNRFIYFGYASDFIDALPEKLSKPFDVNWRMIKFGI